VIPVRRVRFPSTSAPPLCWRARESTAGVPWSARVLRYGGHVGTVAASIEVPLGIEDTWAAAVDWAGQHHWVPGSTVRAIDGTGFGSTIEARTGRGPLCIVDPMEVTAWDPPYRAVLAHTGRIVCGMAIYEMTSLGAERTRFTWTETLDPPHPTLRPLYLIGTPMFGELIRVALRRFVRWAPTRATA